MITNITPLEFAIGPIEAAAVALSLTPTTAAFAHNSK
jgi:hypothetical protein